MTRRKRRKTHTWTEEQKKFIFKINKGRTLNEVTEMINAEFNLNLGENQIKSFRSNNKLVSGLTGQFKKGQESFNKGLKWEEFMSEEGQRRSLATCYKKGSVPLNKKPIGYERKDKRDGHTLIKVSNKGKWHERWKHKHRIVYEEAHGVIPEGHRIMAMDGNLSNINLENLKMITDAEAAVMAKMSLFSDDPELNETGNLIAKVSIKRNQVRRKKDK